MGLGLGGLAIALGLKRKHDKKDEKSEVSSGYYGSSYYGSNSSSKSTAHYLSPNITNISSQAAVQTIDIRGGVRGDSECVLALKILHCLASFSRCFEKGLARSSHRL